MNVQEYLESLVDELTMRRIEVEDQIKALNETLADRKSDLKRIDTILKSIHPEDKSKSQTKAKTNGGIGSRSAPKVLEYMEQHKDEVSDWTASQLAKAIGLHQSSVNAAFNWLRENEKIRATRRVRGGGNAYAPW
jgi:DNA-binding transcriptional ArsR family regulator